MIQIQLNNVSLTLGARPIFTELNWEIQENQKIGLIGPNGAGKSSLFKLITGELTPESGGSITRAKGVTVGYLAQQPVLPHNLTAIECIQEGNPRIRQIRILMEELELKLSDPVVYGDDRLLSQTLDRQMTLLEEYQSLGGDQFESHAETLLTSLGIPTADLEKPVDQLSGGQRKLVGLAGLLMLSPAVLLLDEPDNHLDLTARQFLEKTIREYNGVVVIISHDRYLLDAAVTQIAELEDGKLSIFQGDYSAFILDKEQRLTRQDELYHVQQRQIQRIETAIKRYQIWAKTYDSEKFAKRARAIQNRLDRMEKLDKPLLEQRKIDLKLNGWRGSQKVLELQGVEKTFKGRQLINNAFVTLMHGERVGLIGANGSGKSVLFKMILGELQPDGGDIILGPSIRTGYYAQEHETLDPNKTVLDMVRLAGALSESRGVSFLQRYLFTYRQAFQKIMDLSGGERSRLQLALVVLSGANFLLLDEPTNNLDIPSAEVLEDALSEFEGTVLVISHDRYFLDQVVDRILALEDGCVKSCPGNYSNYLIKQMDRL